MKNFIYALVIFAFAGTVATAQFDEQLQMPNAPEWGEWMTEVVLAPNPITYQVIFIGNTDLVQTVDENGNPNGTTPAKQWHDFIGFTEDNESDDLGWVSVNHEMIFADDKIGDGGGMTVFKVRRDPNTDTLIVVEQTLADGRSGEFFNVDFVNTVGETGMNCGGITSSADGRIWTAEEWFRADNPSIYANGGGVRDTTDWTITSDLPGDFNGSTVKKFQNFNYMVEIDPREAKAIRKQYNWGRQPFEGGAILPDNRTVFTGADDTPGFLTKFVADTPGDFTQGTTYVYKQDEGSYTGTWVEIDNTSLDNMLNFKDKAVEAGASMFNRLEWVAYDKTSGMVYLAETGRDFPGGRWEGEFNDGATFPKHTLDRAELLGVESPVSPDYWDFYGRVISLNPETNEVKSFLEGGPAGDEILYTGVDDRGNYVPYPEKHLSNPDGLNVLYVDGKSFLIINEDLNGTSFGRVPMGVANRTCELFLLDLSIAEPKVDDLIRISVVPLGAEVTGACPTPDGKTILVNSQHPSDNNPFPYNNSLTYALTGWDKVDITSVEIDPTDGGNDQSFSIYPNPVSRELTLNKVTDIAIYDITGQRVKVARNSSKVDVSSLVSGTYFVMNKEGETQKLIVK